MTSLRILLFVSMIVLVGGCRRDNSSNVKFSKTDGGTSSPEMTILSLAGKNADQAACLEVLQRGAGQWVDSQREQLNAAIELQSAELKSKSILTNANDLKFFGSVEFSAADAIFVEECLFLREVEKNVHFRSLPAAERATAAFDWVCRNIYLQGRQNYAVAASPAQIALPIGSGTPTDRMFVFLNLLRQIDLQGFIIGPPELAKMLFATQANNAPPKLAPLWAVGVKIDKSIQLFDPETGKRIDRKDGQPATLADLKTDADLVKKLSEIKRGVPITGEQIRSSIPYLDLPLPAITPRMKIVQEEAKGELNLYIDPVQLANASKEAGFEANVWNAPNDLLNFSRLYLLFGTNPQLFSQMRDRVVPGEAFPRVFLTLQSDESRNGLLRVFANAFLKFHFPVEGAEGEPPVQEMFRGSLSEAINKLLTMKDAAEAERKIITANPNLEAQVFEWCKVANTAFAASSRAQRGNDPTAKAIADSNLAQILKNSGAPMELLERTILVLSAKEALYYLAMAVHEKADRLQIRLQSDKDKAGAAGVKDAWRDAVDWWSRYLNFSIGAADRENAARTKHAQELMEIAKQKAELR